MSGDARGAKINRDDLVVWFGRIPGDKSRVHLGAVDGFTFFGNVRVSGLTFDQDCEYRANGVEAVVRPGDLMVIQDAVVVFNE